MKKTDDLPKRPAKSPQPTKTTPNPRIGGDTGESVWEAWKALPHEGTHNYQGIDMGGLGTFGFDPQGNLQYESPIFDPWRDCTCEPVEADVVDKVRESIMFGEFQIERRKIARLVPGNTEFGERIIVHEADHREIPWR